MVDLCATLHCDLMMQFKKPKGKYNATAATRNCHLCEVLIIFLYLILITYPSVDHRTYLVL